MTIRDRKAAIKSKLDDLQDEARLLAIEALLSSVEEEGTAANRKVEPYVLSEARYAAFERRRAVVLAGGGTPQAEVKRRYGIA